MDLNSKKDMAVCLVVFNPAKSKRIIMNYFYAKSKFNLQKIPVYTLELVYEGRKPEIPNAFYVKSNSFMFHKENMYKVLEKKIPPEYKKLAFLDSDILFSDSSWYEKASTLLETYEVLQPFENAYWLDLTYTKIQITRKTTALDKDKFYLSTLIYHPGFAWCVQRDWFVQNGFFEYAFCGSSDLLSSIVWQRKRIPHKFNPLPIACVKAFQKYGSTIQIPKMYYVKDIDLYHLYHGARINRKYNNREKMLSIQEDIRELVQENEDGIFEWKEPTKWNPIFLNYFQERNDDGLSLETEEELKQFRPLSES